MKNDQVGRVLVVGGGGGMGRHAARTVAGLGHHVVVADCDGDAARRVAASVGAPARGTTLDITDPVALHAALRSCDVVVNAAGPFQRFGPLVLEAAIDAGRDYLDLCDDPDPTVAMLDFDARAQQAGVRAVVGMGASPGVSNLLAALAIAELDETRWIVTGWNGEGATPEPGSGSAAVEHGIEQATGLVWAVRGGIAVRERPLRRVRIDYPGVGTRAARTFGHPEPLTLHRTFAVRESFNVTHGRRRFVWPLVALGRAVDRGLLSPACAARLAHRAEALAPSPSLSALVSPERLPPLFALAVGLHDQRPASVGVALTAVPGATMGAITGVPLGVATDLLLRSADVTLGVHAPETAFRGDEFLLALAPHCAAGPNDLIVITRSWENISRERYRTACVEAASHLSAVAIPTPGGAA